MKTKTYPVHIPDQKIKNAMDLLIISHKIKSHYVYIKDFNKSMFNKTKIENKKYFFTYFLQCFSCERILVEQKDICLKINGKQTVKLKNGFIKFKNVDFECVIKGSKSNKKTSGSYIKIQKSISKKYQDHIPGSFAYKLVCADDKFSQPVVPYRCENEAYGFIKMMLAEFVYSKKVMKKHFNKNSFMTEKGEETF